MTTPSHATTKELVLSAMLLIDGNFASIVNAVEEGREIYDNIQKFLIRGDAAAAAWPMSNE